MTPEIPTVPVSCVYVATEGDRLNVYIEVNGERHRTHSIAREGLTHNEVSDFANVGKWDALRTEAKPIHPPCCITTHYRWLASGVRGYDAQTPCACPCHAPTEAP